MIFLSLLYSSRQQEGHPTNVKAEATPNSHERLSLQLVKNIAYAGKLKHTPPLKGSSIEGSTQPKQYDTTTDQEMSPAPPSSGDPMYSYLEHVPISCDSCCEWESQYSKLSYDNMDIDPTSKKHALSSVAYRQKSKPHALDDKHYASPRPSVP